MKLPKLRWVLLVWLAGGISLSDAAPAGRRPPNQIVILIDDVARDWIGAYGAAAQTPNIDRLASEGTRFTTAWCTPLCTPTRVSLLTGEYPFRTGWTVHYDVPRWGGRGLDPTRWKTLGQSMRAAGYATAIAGKWQVNDLRAEPGILNAHGFDEHCVWTGVEAGNPASEKRYWDAFIQQNGEPRARAGEFGPDVTQAFVIDFIRRHRTEPFFIYYPMIEAHAPNEPTPLTRAHPPKGEAALFADMVAYADRQVGELVRTVDQLGLRDDTVIFFAGDNGSSTGGELAGRAVPMGKGRVNDVGVHVPLIVRAPGRVRAGAVSTALTDFTDLLPTMLAIAGEPVPKDAKLDGRSLWPVLRGEEDQTPREWIFTQYGSQRAVRDERYYYDSEGACYDLSVDPFQQRDLRDDSTPAVKAEREKLRRALAGRPADAPVPFPEYANAARLLEESIRRHHPHQHPEK
ncbi:sulfatase-like hydrolase/transferase [Horticoccus luteus]|uniref:Sulfatase-like hydrolase/transferase n=1 Tax=Horticoccus luteus TaxID=2862869 RepID=A0A8F9TTS5_9BACT|nr:sulfatase-like hydrolase/transferase [Horticoccus luteus]QYM77643.1 sulfatase-like hydrolase/transferase [Horticoccus luteus]